MGQQMKVMQDQYVYVNRINASIGENVSFDKVLLSSNNGSVAINPAGALVKVEVLEHLQDDKKIVFKKKRRKGYQKKNGHRQQLTKIKISSINL